MRLIDVDALIETLSDKLPKWGFKTIDMHVVKTLIKNEPTISQWIPVSERLPQDGELVAASNINGYIHIYLVGNIAWCVDIENKEILAWIPLPEPYKESEE